MAINRFIFLLPFILALSVQLVTAGVLEEDSQSAVQKLSAVTAWQDGYKGHGITIAILDSGIDKEHPYLDGKTSNGLNVTECNNNFSDQHGHGTHIAGIIASTAPDAEILSIKVLNHQKRHTATECSPGVYVNSISAGFDQVIHYAEQNPTKRIIINASFGFDPLSENVNGHWICSKARAAIDKGIPVIAAAMNNSNSSPRVPAACDGVIAVANAEKNNSSPGNHLAASSNFGAWVKIAAPGEQVLSTQLSESRVGISPSNCSPPPAVLPNRMCGPSDYRQESGTSMSTAMVSASAAILMSINPSILTATNLLEYLNNGAEDIDSHSTFKKINLPAAVAAVPKPPLPPILQPPGTPSDLRAIISH